MNDEREEPAGKPASEGSVGHRPSAREVTNDEDDSKDAPKGSAKQPFRVRALHTDNDESGGH